MNRLIAAGAAGYAGLGVFALFRPAMVPALFGGTAPTADSRAEIRAVYGGLPLAVAGSLAVAPSTAVSMGVISAGMAVGRAASGVIEGQPPSPVIKAFIGIEAALAAALFLGARQRSRSVG